MIESPGAAKNTAVRQAEFRIADFGLRIFHHVFWETHAWMGYKSEI